MKISHCENCLYFEHSKAIAGVCRRLALVKRQDGYILDSPAVFAELHWNEQPALDFIVVPVYFGCIYHDRKQNGLLARLKTILFANNKERKD